MVSSTEKKEVADETKSVWIWFHSFLDQFETFSNEEKNIIKEAIFTFKSKILLDYNSNEDWKKFVTSRRTDFLKNLISDLELGVENYLSQKDGLSALVCRFYINNIEAYLLKPDLVALGIFDTSTKIIDQRKSNNAKNQ